MLAFARTLLLLNLARLVWGRPSLLASDQTIDWPSEFILAVWFGELSGALIGLSHHPITSIKSIAVQAGAHCIVFVYRARCGRRACKTVLPRNTKRILEL